MASSKKQSNGRSPLVNPQRQITSFFSKTMSPSPSPALASKQTPKSNLKPKPNTSSSPPSPDPNPTTPSPSQSKHKKPLLVVGQTPSPSPSPSPSTPGIANGSYGKEVVERRIKVYWPLDKAWYEGCVKSYDQVSGKHFVQYDDSEEELLDLGKEKIEWAEESVKKFRRLRKGSLGFSRKIVIEDEEMEDAGDAEEGNGGGGGVGDDSSDEDWAKTKEFSAGEEEDIEFEDEREEDGEDNGKRGKRIQMIKSRKRKPDGKEKLGSQKKSKNGEDVGKGGFKVSVVEPVKKKESK